MSSRMKSDHACELDFTFFLVVAHLCDTGNNVKEALISMPKDHSAGILYSDCGNIFQMTK